MEEYGFDLFGSEQEPGVGPYENSFESLGSTKCREFLD
jgi:hypothetical protein